MSNKKGVPWLKNQQSPLSKAENLLEEQFAIETSNK